ncbi:MAG: hypothetical protein Q8P93_01530 [bacterium]|nr:hypothetical protein [bacterium]
MGTIKISKSRINMADARLEQATLKDYAETLNALGSVSSTTDIDFEDGNVVTATISGATTFTFSNPPVSGTAGSFTLILTNGGSDTITWPDAVQWPSETAPILMSSGVDVLSFFTTDGGTTYHGVATLLDAKEVTFDETLWTWGYGISGQLGHGDTTSLSSPVQVGALATWSSVSAGKEHTAAVKTDGTLWTWGTGSYGRLGHDNTTYLSSPVQVGGLATWSSVSAGNRHTAAVKTDGTLWTWGYGPSGQLGHDNTTYLSSPVQVGGLATWSSVSAGNLHTAARQRIASS